MCSLGSNVELAQVCVCQPGLWRELSIVACALCFSDLFSERFFRDFVCQNCRRIFLYKITKVFLDVRPELHREAFAPQIHPLDTNNIKCVFLALSAVWKTTLPDLYFSFEAVSREVFVMISGKFVGAFSLTCVVVVVVKQCKQ